MPAWIYEHLLTSLSIIKRPNISSWQAGFKLLRSHVGCGADMPRNGGCWHARGSCAVKCEAMEPLVLCLGGCGELMCPRLSLRAAILGADVWDTQGLFTTSSSFSGRWNPFLSLESKSEVWIRHILVSDSTIYQTRQELESSRFQSVLTVSSETPSNQTNHLCLINLLGC